MLIALPDLEATRALGERLGRVLRAGDFVGLSGTLGAGKTTLVRAIAIGAGVPAEEVSSPTFALVHRYRGRALELHHADLYRLGSRDELHAIGYFDLLDGESVLLVEWVDGIASASPEQWLELRLTLGSGPDTRTLEAIGYGSRGQELQRAL